jgi:hypothetical protein
MKTTTTMFMAALVFTACSSGARESATAAREKQAPVEPERVPVPEQEQAGSGGAVLHSDTVLRIGLCWFDQPYSYMFQGTGVSIKNKAFGMLMGGISGILYYGDLNTCMAAVNGKKPKSYSDNTPFEELSGIPVMSEAHDYSKPFGYYNPDIIRWGHENLIPAADASVAGVPVQDIYDKVFSRFFRMMTESYLYLVDSGTYSQEMSAYMDMAEKKSQDGLDWLQSRYKNALPAYSCPWDGTTMTPQMAVGFWLRRGLDGTSQELWTGLRKVMKRFDASWYSSLAKSYPSSDIEW